MTRLVLDLAQLRDVHDVFLVDQFGVLHDGETAYPGAINAVSELKASGATIVLLSNSGTRAAPNEARLARLGFDPGRWDLFLSSGELAWRIFADGAGERSLRPGTKCLLFSRRGERSAVADLPIEVVDRADEAEIVLLTGSDGDRVELGWYRERLKPAALRGLPCICTNPDKIMLTRNGAGFGAGRIADLYVELGGSVTWIGKPYPEIYSAALSSLGSPGKARVVGIGDSIEHDIAGAKGSGLSAALVRSGVLASAAPEDLEALYLRHGERPDYILPAFLWHS